MKRKKILALTLIVCLLIFLNFILHLEPSELTEKQRTEIQKKLSSLSKAEAQQIKELFDYFFFFEDFAYTLFGTKPMSIGFLRPQSSAYNGWKAWQKIFPPRLSKKYILRKYQRDDREFILLANLDAIERIYLQNQSQFDRRFQGRMNLETLILCLKEDSPLFQELVQDHLLLGILLGYGVHNAELFEYNYNLEKENRVPLQFFSKNSTPIFYSFSAVMPLNFACDPSTEETKELKKRYQAERESILKRAKKDPLFIQMLTLFAEEEEPSFVKLPI